METTGVLAAFIYTLIAGSSTGIGGILSLFVRKDNMRFLSGSLGFSAGVMIYIALGELLDEADALIYQSHGHIGSLITAAAFFGGMLLIAAVDKLLPDDGISAKLIKTADNPNSAAILHTGTAAAIAMAVHNFPEGLATFVSAVGLPDTAIAIVAAIAIHNIPEGMAVAVPVYMATGSRSRAFIYSLMSGLTEPIGAAAGYLLLRPFLSPMLYAILFAVTAGIMTFIAVSELIPASHKYGNPGDSTLGTVLGMAVMCFCVMLSS